MRLIKKLILLISVSFLMPGNLLFAADIPEPKKEFTEAELTDLLEPIALYPDLLLQQTLAASTFPEQLLDAAAFNQTGKDPQLISKQPWDPSVQAMANYPSLLDKMVNDLNWTLNLASAFVNQSVEVRSVIQKLRAKAKAVGNLGSSEQTKVSTTQNVQGNTVITIEAADPQVVYIPAETSTVIYQEPVDTTSYWAPVATFGLGMALGYAMGDDDDDHYYYGGYYGPGFWNREDAVDDWMDYRQDRWDDAYDFAKDRQEWRQDNRDDWREYQQDLGRSRQDLQAKRQEFAGKATPEQRAQAQSRASQAKSDWQSKSPEQKKSAFNQRASDFDRQQANQRLEKAKSNPQFQQKLNSSSGQFSKARSNMDPSRNFSGSSFDRDQMQNRAQANRGQYQQRSQSGFSGLSSSGSAVNRAQARGSFSRANSGGFSRSAGGAARGGGGRRR